MINTKLLAFIFTLLISSVSIFGYSDRVELETLYMAKAQKVLDGIYGPGNFIVQVDILLTTPKFEVKYTEQSDPKLKKKKKEEKVNLLPGYPVIKNLAPANLNSLPFDSVTTYMEARIRRITVMLYVSRSFPRGQVARAKKVLQNVLNLNARRGDKIQEEYKRFYEPPESQKIQIVEQAEKLLSIQNLFLLLFLLLLIGYLVLYTLFQIKMNKVMVSSAESAGASVSVNPNIELPKGKGGGGGGGGVAGGKMRVSKAPPVKQYFEFVSDDNVDKLIHILGEEKVSIEHLSTLISFVEPDIGARILSELDTKTQAVVSTAVLSQKMVNRPSVEKFEGQVKNWIECLTGGEGDFKAIFETVSGDSKKEILEELKTNDPEGYKKFRLNVVFFDDLQYLTDDEMKQLLSELNLEQLSVAVSGIDQVVFQKIDNNLTKSGKDMIQQFLDLKGDSMNKQDIEKAQDSIMGDVMRLEREGVLDLTEKIKSLVA